MNNNFFLQEYNILGAIVDIFSVEKLNLLYKVFEDTRHEDIQFIEFYRNKLKYDGGPEAAFTKAYKSSFEHEQDIKKERLKKLLTVYTDKKIKEGVFNFYIKFYQEISNLLKKIDLVKDPKKEFEKIEEKFSIKKNEKVIVSTKLVLDSLTFLEKYETLYTEFMDLVKNSNKQIKYKKYIKEIINFFIIKTKKIKIISKKICLAYKKI